MRRIKHLLKLLFTLNFTELIKVIKLKWAVITGSEIKYIYNNGFFKSSYCHKKWTSDFANLIIESFNPKSIVDFGCGTGDLLFPFEKKGISILGIDGSKAVLNYLEIPKKKFMLRDLRKKITLKNNYELCFCFEIAEHMEERYSDVLINNLISSGADTILFTAAQPGQGGLGHVNEKESDWWIERFQERGIKYDESMTKNLVGKMKLIDGIKEWYYKNLMVFKN